MANPSVQQSLITQLADKISQQTASISQYLHEHEIPSPSFEADSPGIPEALEAVCLNVFEATRDLGQLLLGPKQSLFLKMRDNIASMHAISSYKLAQLVPVNGEISYLELACLSGLNEIDLRRIIRHAMTDRIFKETRKGFVAHTAASKTIAEDSKLSDFLDVNYNEVHQARCQTVNAMKKFPGSKETTHCGFALSTGGEPFFPYLEKRPDRAQKFASGMSLFSSGPGWATEHILHAFDWSSLSIGKVVDMGGSTGEVMAALSEQFPHLQCTVQDLPSTIEKRPALPPHLDTRVKFMAHDFFTEQPITGADVYFMRMILHDWSDVEAIRILRQLIPALKPGAHILLDEYCLPEPNTMSWLEEKHLRTLDMDMLSLFNSRERDGDDWRELFGEADRRFVLKGIDKPKGSSLSFVHAIWEP